MINQSTHYELLQRYRNWQGFTIKPRHRMMTDAFLRDKSLPDETRSDSYAVTLLDVADQLTKVRHLGFALWTFTHDSFTGSNTIDGVLVHGWLTITIEDGCKAIGIDVPKPKMQVSYKRVGGPARATNSNRVPFITDIPDGELIGRGILLPPMTLARAVEVLNNCNYGNSKTWRILTSGMVGRNDQDTDAGLTRSPYDTIAIAEKLQREDARAK